MDINPIPFIIAVAFIFPLSAQLGYYYKTKSEGYLRFALLFIFYIIFFSIRIIRFQNIILDLISTVSFLAANYVLITLAEDITTSNFQNIFLYSKIAVIVINTICFLLLGLIEYTIIGDIYLTIYDLLLDSVNIIAGLMVVLGFYTSHPLMPTKKTLHLKHLWIVVGSSLTLIGILNVYIFSRVFVSDLQSPDMLDLPTIRSIADILTVLVGIIVSSLAILLPETMLYSNNQIQKYKRLSSFLERIERENMKNEVAKTPDNLGKYLYDIAKYLESLNMEDANT